MKTHQFQPELERHPYPLLFVTISGAHLYGFPSPNSDYDLRGVHILPAAEVLGLHKPRETIESAARTADAMPIDLVTHDAAKFFHLLLKTNGYVLEQLYSPLIVHTTPAHDELKSIAAGCITRHHVHHYLGFARTQWELFEKDARSPLKPLLYVYRVLLTGMHLMQTGRVEANLTILNGNFRLSFIADLMTRKATDESAALPDADVAFHRAEYLRLCSVLEDAARQSHLPEAPTALPALSDLLVRLRGIPTTPRA